MDSSVLQAFSILKNSRQLVKRSVEGRKLFNVCKCLHPIVLERANEYYVSQAKQIFNDIENSKYGYNDVALFIFHHSAIGKVPFITEKSILRTKMLYSKERLEQDKIRVLSINKKLMLKKFNRYFDLDSEGKSIIFRLVKRGLISPLFWIEYDRFWEVDDKQEETFEHFKFRKCCELIKTQVLSGGN